MRIIFKSKRADVSVVLLVFMTLVLCSISLFVFLLSSSSSQASVSNVGLVNGVYSDQADFEYYLYNLARNVISENPGINSEDFIKTFKKEYVLDLKNQYSEEQYGKQVAGNKYDITMDGKNLNFLLEDFVFSREFNALEKQEILNITYRTNISFKIQLQ